MGLKLRLGFSTVVNLMHLHIQQIQIIELRLDDYDISLYFKSDFIFDILNRPILILRPWSLTT